MLDNMVVPLSNGDVDISMLKEAVKLIEGRFETEVKYICFFIGGLSGRNPYSVDMSYL